MKTFYIHARLGDLFEDLYIKAGTRADAVAEAKAQLRGTALDSRWTNFV